MFANNVALIRGLRMLHLAKSKERLLISAGASEAKHLYVKTVLRS